LKQNAELATKSPASIYQDYLVPAIFVPAAKLLLEIAAPKTNERVLDLACGTGVVARQVAPLIGKEGSVTAIDLNAGMLAVARSLPQAEGAVIDWREGNVMALPFPDKSFELALCQQGLQFFPDKLAALQEVRRVLRRGGRLVVAVQQSLDKNPIFQSLNAALVKHMGVPAIAMPFSFGNPQELLSLLENAGYQAVQLNNLSHPIRFANLNEFVFAIMFGSAAAVPAFAQMDIPSRLALIDGLTQDLEELFAPYMTADGLVFPIAVNIACGIA
jgi:ubiquinone/menaquinone biosynthesis C-methylase UbiE